MAATFVGTADVGWVEIIGDFTRDGEKTRRFDSNGDLVGVGVFIGGWIGAGKEVSAVWGRVTEMIFFLVRKGLHRGLSFRHGSPPKCGNPS